MDFKETVVDVSKKAKDVATKTYKAVADKSEKIFEETKTRINSSDMEIEITKLFEKIGMKIFDLYKSDKKVQKDKEVEKDIKQIEKLKQKIEKNEEKILFLRGERICESCEEIISVDIKYCPYCGTKQKKITVKENKEKIKEKDKKICPECGTTHEREVKFCTKCGYKFK